MVSTITPAQSLRYFLKSKVANNTILQAIIVTDEKRTEAGTTVGVGSVAGGGRYDNLVGSFAGGKGKSNVPCVGVSLGIERLFALMEKKVAAGEVKIRSSASEVYVVSGQKGQLENRVSILNELWSANIPAETSYKPNPKLLTELQHCEVRFLHKDQGKTNENARRKIYLGWYYLDLMSWSVAY